MAHFAKVENGIVTSVIVVNNVDCDDLPFPESETVGREFLAASGFEGDYWQTSYSGSFRGRFAGLADIYDADTDEFIHPATLVPVEEIPAP